MKIVSSSHIGLVRAVNEDRCFTQKLDNGTTIAIVADGMGGHNAGDIASEMAINLLVEHFQSINFSLPIEQCVENIHQAMVKTNHFIHRESLSKPEYLGMGTTLVVAISFKNYFLIAHIGDSRAYLIRNHQILQLTTDHTLVTELVKRGQISDNDALHHPRKNILTRALGTELTVETDIQSFQWAQGDILLLCTDGLSGYVETETILHTILQSEDIHLASNQLIQLALHAGGLDNITVALIAHDNPTRGGNKH